LAASAAIAELLDNVTENAQAKAVCRRTAGPRGDSGRDGFVMVGSRENQSQQHRGSDAFDIGGAISVVSLLQARRIELGLPINVKVGGLLKVSA
jgi:hypothetical protein